MRSYIYLFAAALAWPALSAASDCDDWTMPPASLSDEALSGELSPEFLAFMEENYNFRDGLDRWGAWGRGTPKDSNTGFGKLANTLSLFHGIENRGGVFEWAEDFLIDNHEIYVPSCDDSGKRAKAKFALPDAFVFLENFFPSRTILYRLWFEDIPILRAATLFHEARHHDGAPHRLGTPGDCFSKNSCDDDFMGFGANTFTVLWIADAYERVNIGGVVQRRHPRALEGDCIASVEFANNPYLLSRYVNKTRFRLDRNALCRDLDVSVDVRPADVRERFQTFATASEVNGGSVSAPMAQISGTDQGEVVNNACFFVHISGRFDDRSEGVMIEDRGVGDWWLDSSSARTNYSERLFAQARCTAVASPVRPYSFSTGQGSEGVYPVPKIELLPESAETASCFLQSIRGRLNRSKDLVHVLTTAEGGWAVTVQREQAGAATEISGTVGCVDVSNGNYWWWTSESGTEEGEGRPLVGGFDHNGPGGRIQVSSICAIAGLSGHMDGHLDRVQIAPKVGDETGSGFLQGEGNWVLQVDDDRTASGEDVTGWATCFRP